MRLSIDHHTRYQFSVPQARVVQLLHMTPLDTEGQTVLDWRIDVDCDARLREGTDGYGNHTTMLYVDGPIEALAITVRGQVLTEDMAGVVKGAHEPLPPIFFTRTSPATAIRVPGPFALNASFGVSPRFTNTANPLFNVAASAVLPPDRNTPVVPAITFTRPGVVWIVVTPFARKNSSSGSCGLNPSSTRRSDWFGSLGSS